MSCSFPAHVIEQTIAFHGHYCPGLAIGIRAAEVAITRLGSPEEIQMVAVSETDMCGVDAIQFLTGCTYGKGNLLHRDFGKMAFSFYDRNCGEGFRIVLNRATKDMLDEEIRPLIAKVGEGAASEVEHRHLQGLREAMKQKLMAIDLDELFVVGKPTMAMPRPARILDSLICEECGEGVMESRTRRFQGLTLCIPCFDKVEQKL